MVQNQSSKSHDLLTFSPLYGSNRDNRDDIEWFIGQASQSEAQGPFWLVWNQKGLWMQLDGPTTN